MSPARHLLFILKSSLLGLMMALLLLWWNPQWQSQGGIEVPIEESPYGPGERDAPLDYPSAIAQAAPSVVSVHSRLHTPVQRSLGDPLLDQLYGREATPRAQVSLGSGVLVSGVGYILTNHHVVDGAEAIFVTLRDGRSTQARLVGSDVEADLAVLQVDLPDLPHIVLGHADYLRVGDVVLAIGNPFGVGQTVTQGIVSALGRRQLGINTFEDFIQTDADINPGNSGGALINAYGELVGINTAIFSEGNGSVGISFAIPIEMARASLQQIIEFGRVMRGWLGLTTEALTPFTAKLLNVPLTTHGLVVLEVTPKGPAYLAGIRPGDLILGVNGQEPQSDRELVDLVSAQRPGDTVELRLVRRGVLFAVNMVSGERPTQPH